MKKQIKILLSTAAISLLTACGETPVDTAVLIDDTASNTILNNTNIDQNTSFISSDQQIIQEELAKGTAIDAYLSGATVCIDANNDGVANDEICTYTDAYGEYELSARLVAESPVAVTGGIDVLTGEAYVGSMSAPAGATVVTPLTTLVNDVVKSGKSVEEAQKSVNKALGLPETTSLTTLDPIRAAIDGDATTARAAQSVLAVQTKVQVIQQTLATAIAKASTKIDIHHSSVAVTDQMAAIILEATKTPTQIVDFNQTELTTVLTDATAKIIKEIVDVNPASAIEFVATTQTMSIIAASIAETTASVAKRAEVIISTATDNAVIQSAAVIRTTNNDVKTAVETAVETKSTIIEEINIAEKVVAFAVKTIPEIVIKPTPTENNTIELNSIIDSKDEYDALFEELKATQIKSDYITTNEYEQNVTNYLSNLGSVFFRCDLKDKYDADTQTLYVYYKDSVNTYTPNYNVNLYNNSIGTYYLENTNYYLSLINLDSLNLRSETIPNLMITDSIENTLSYWLYFNSNMAASIAQNHHGKLQVEFNASIVLSDKYLLANFDKEKLVYDNTISGNGFTTYSKYININVNSYKIINKDTEEIIKEFIVDNDINNSIDLNAGTVPNENDIIFDSSNGALYDLKACNSAFVTADPLQDSNGNSYREAFDTTNGIKVMSLYPETFDELDSLVTVYYDKFPSDQVLKNDRTLFYGDNSRYYVGYDLAWLDVADAFLYIKLPKLDSEKQSCYKLTLDKAEGTSATVQKVYR